MLDIFEKIDPMILDVSVLAVFVLIVFFGVMRGAKKTIFSFCILGMSLFLGFCPWTKTAKNMILDKIPLEQIEISPEDFKWLLNGNKFKNVYKMTGEILLLKDGCVVALAFAEGDYIQPKKVLL